jgi:dipeptidyl aminopeptidase/acylaminoacyl peptidase
MPAPTRTRLSPEDLGRLPRACDPDLSPDGRWVAFAETVERPDQDRETSALVVVDTVTARARALTSGEHRDREPRWLPDGRGLVFVSDRSGTSELWRAGREGGDATRLTNLRGEVGDPQVSPDGRRVAFRCRPRPAFPAANGAHRAAKPVRTDSPASEIWILTLGTGAARRLARWAAEDARPAWSPDGTRLAFVSARSARDGGEPASGIHVVTVRGGESRALDVPPGAKRAPAWSPDGRTIAFLAPAHAWDGRPRSAFAPAPLPEAADNVHVWVAPARGGRARDLMQHADLMADDRFALGPARPAPRLDWSADGRRVFFLASSRGATNLWEVGVHDGALVQRSFGAQAIEGWSRSPAGDRLVFVRSTPTVPSELWLASWDPSTRGSPRARALVPGARTRCLARPGAALLRRLHLVPPREIRIPIPGGHEIQGWIFARGTQRGATVIALHDGPYTMTGAAWCFELQALAAEGLRVVVANLRGSAGYGFDFMRALVGRWGTADYDDLQHVTEALERHPAVDGRRIALHGEAYGGYLASWALAHTRRYRGAVVTNGVSNLVSLHGTSDRGPALVREFEEQSPWESMDRWWRVSPLAHVGAVRDPILLLHADDDRRVPASQAGELYTALRVQKRDVEWVRLLPAADGRAARERPRVRVERLRYALDWYRRKL